MRPERTKNRPTRSVLDPLELRMFASLGAQTAYRWHQAHIDRLLRMFPELRKSSGRTRQPGAVSLRSSKAQTLMQAISAHLDARASPGGEPRVVPGRTARQSERHSSRLSNRPPNRPHWTARLAPKARLAHFRKMAAARSAQARKP